MQMFQMRQILTKGLNYKQNQIPKNSKMRKSFESKKRKMTIRGIEDSQQDVNQVKSSFRDSSSALYVHNQKSQNSAEHLRQALQKVSASLAEQKQTRMALEQKVTRIYTRGIQRQQQFQHLLQETIPFCSSQRNFQFNNNNLEKIHKRLLMFFQKTSEMTEKKLTNQTQELQGMMQRKIKTITAHMQAQLTKSKRMLRLNYENIRKQIKQIIQLTTSVLEQNQELKKDNSELKFKNLVAKEEKNMLMFELVEKKNIIAKIYKELKQKYSKDDVIQQEINILKNQRKEVEELYDKYQKQIRTKLQANMFRHQQIKAKSIYAFADIQESKYPDKKYITTDKHNTICNNQISVTMPTRKTQKYSPQRILTTVETRKTSTASRASYNPNKTQSITYSRISQDIQDTNKIIIQLKKSLRNQKRKSSEQTKKLTQIQIHQKEIQSMVRQVLLEEMAKLAKGERQESSQKILKNAGKICQMIKQLGRRMLSTCNPAVNSGYNDLSSLLEQFGVQKVNDS